MADRFYRDNPDHADKRNDHIARRHAGSGQTIRQTAEEFGLSKSHAHRIIKGKRDGDRD